MPNPPISAIVLTHQSERTLDQVLSSLRWCDEIVVVDSGSTDQSLEIAKRHQARIFEREFKGYGPQKKFAVDQAKNDWVFVVDSDEVVSQELGREIQELFKGGKPPAGHTGYEVQIRLVFLEREMRFGGTGSKHHLRLFSRLAGNFNEALVHEGIEIQGTTARLNHGIRHYSYLTVEDYFTKFNLYTTYAARDLAKEQKSVPAWMIWTSFPVHFIKRYWFKCGFLDGYQGLLWALFSALYPTVKYAKLAELNKPGARS